MQCIILAGGEGKRLRAEVSDLPKPLAPIGGHPFLAYLLAHLERHGVADIILAVGYHNEQIVEAFGPRYGQMNLRYAIERKPLGTGGALRQALGMVDRFPAFAVNGDTYLDLDLGAMRRAHDGAKARLTVAVRRVVDTGRYGRVVVAHDRIVAFAASGAGPGLINCGTYLFADNPLVEPRLPDRFSFETEFLARNVKALAPLAFETTGYFIDIGVPADYHRAQTELLHREVGRPCDVR